MGRKGFLRNTLVVKGNQLRHSLWYSSRVDSERTNSLGVICFGHLMVQYRYQRYAKLDRVRLQRSSILRDHGMA